MKELKKFIENYNIQDIKISPRRMYSVNPPDSYALAYDYVKHNVETVNYYEMSMPESKLERIAHIVNEFEELMQDPETAKLLMEARFINRLKRGSY
jgi:hypothetical protein